MLYHILRKMQLKSLFLTFLRFWT